MPDLSTPVVVLRSIGHAGLGITRSLGSWGASVYTLEANPLTPAFYSRFSRGRYVWSLGKHSPEESVSFLISIGQKLGRGALLFPTVDEAAIFLAENREVLSSYFRFSPQRAELIKSLCSKRQMYWLASGLGVPVPETKFPRTPDEVADLASALTYPVLLKGVDGDRMCRRSGRRLFITTSTDELLRLYRELDDPENIMLQNYIPGPEENCWIFHGYFDAKGTCLAAFTGRKVRQSRAYAGATSYGTWIQNTRIKDTTIRFLKTIGFSGIVDVCLRYDPRDDQYKILDVNPRIGANFRIFVEPGGLDLARIYYLHMTGQPCHTPAVAEGRSWIVEDFDLVSSFRYWSDGNLAIGDWLRSLRNIDEFAFLSLKDPLPLVPRMAADLQDCGSRLKTVFSFDRQHRTRSQSARPPAASPKSGKEVLPRV